MTTNLEYQDECSLIRFPFRDSATMLWINGSITGVLPNNIFLDAVLTLGDGSTGIIALSSIVYNGASWAINFTGHAAFTVNVASIAYGSATLSNRNGTNLLRVDVDTQELSNYFTTNSLAAGTYVFDGSCQICLSCVKLLPPTITQIKFINTATSGPITIADITSGEVVWNEGANFGLVVNGQTVTTNVIAGNGTGLYDGCITSKQPVLTINNIGPNNEGNYFIGTDNCYSLITDTHSLHLNDACEPECVPSSLVNFAHYINRVVDATIQLSLLVTGANTNYTTLVTNYNDCEANKLAAQSPYIMAQANVQANKVSQFYNITCGIYSPGATAIPASLTVAYNSNLVEVSGTCYLIDNNIKNSLPDPVLTSGVGPLFTSFSLPPTSVTYTGLVLSQPVATANDGSANNDVTFTLSTSAGVVSGYTLSLNPVSFNYTTTYSVSTVGSNIQVTILVDFVDPSLGTQLTSLTVSSPGVFAVVSSLLDRGGSVTTLAGAGFTAESLDFNQANHYTLVLSCPGSTTGAQTINLIGTSTTGSASKALTITL